MIHSRQIEPGLESTRPSPVGAVQSGASKITSGSFSAQRPDHLAKPLGPFGGGKRMPAFMRLKLEREMRGGKSSGIFGGGSQSPAGGGSGKGV